MVSPLSHVVANLYMEYFEQRALNSAMLKPKVFLRYVDDTFVIWPHGRQSLENFVTLLNSIHPNIQFTMEVENNRSLPFLDVLVTRKEDGTLGHSVYRKPAHTDRYLNAASHHHPLQKNAVLNTLANRALKISDKENIDSEIKHLVATLQQNGYSKSSVIRAIKVQSRPRKTKQIDELKERERQAFLPYVQGTTNKIGKILKKYKHYLPPI